MCKFCENNEWIYFKSGLSMGLNGNKIDFDYNTCACGSFEDEITIKYCPICGKKLMVNRIDLTKEKMDM